MHKNIGLYLSNSSDKKFILKEIMENRFLREIIDLSHLNGALFSQITIEKLIDGELRHDHFPIHSNENNSLQSMSSGQQRKALLAYLIKQQPQYIILDDVYSNIDKTTQLSITETLISLSKTTRFIQIFFRKRDILPFIDTVFSIDTDNKITKRESAVSFQNKNTDKLTTQHKFSLPEQYTTQHINIDPLIQLNSISTHYGDKMVLKNINWTIKKGEFWQLVGPNGAGKSTLITLITGDNPRGYGQDMILFGRRKGSGETIWDIKRQIGYFTPSMIDQFTHNDSVENMIISGLVDSVGLYIVPSDLQKDLARHWIKMLGPSFQNKSFQQLSTGQQRMVMVARAMVKHPPLLILDEPTIELDDENSAVFIDMINVIAAEKKVAIIYVSHRDEEGLQPDKIFELIPSQKSYTGRVSTVTSPSL